MNILITRYIINPSTKMQVYCRIIDVHGLVAYAMVMLFLSSVYSAASLCLQDPVKYIHVYVVT